MWQSCAGEPRALPNGAGVPSLEGVPRPPRLAFEGALYHVTSRGVDGTRIFRSSGDRTRFLTLLQIAVERFGWRCHGYCLMGNHYHLLIETPQANVSAGMQWLNGTYAQGFNRRYDRKGHLFGARFHSVVVADDKQLVATDRYMVWNPVRARICKSVADYSWSSYRATAGIVTPPRFLTVSLAVAPFGEDVARAQLAYREFVATQPP